MGETTQQIVERAMRGIRTGDPHLLLGTSPGAPGPEVRRAYLSLLRSLHPSRVSAGDAARYGREIEQIVEEAAEAHAQLTNEVRAAGSGPPADRVGMRRGELPRYVPGGTGVEPILAPARAASARRAVSIPQPKPRQQERRAQPATKGATGGKTRGATQPGSAAPPAGQTDRKSPLDVDNLMHVPADRLGNLKQPVAEGLLQRASACFNRGEMTRAERYLERARELCPDEARYCLRLGWTILRNPDRDAKERVEAARPLFEHAAVLAAWDPEVRYRFAQYWREAGNRENYRSELEAALRCEGPRHVQASKELENLREAEKARAAKTGPETPQPGLLRRLFKRA